jgi:hypothetical protein
MYPNIIIRCDINKIDEETGVAGKTFHETSIESRSPSLGHVA